MMSLEDKARAFAERGEAGTANDALVIVQWGAGEWATLFSYGTMLTLSSGSTLIQQQEPYRTLYFLISGRLEAAASYGEQTLAPLRVVYPGSVVGEVAFLDGAPRSARVWAVEDCELLQLNFEDYARFAAENMKLANDLLFGLGGLVAMRLRHLTVRTTSR